MAEMMWSKSRRRHRSVAIESQEGGYGRVSIVLSYCDMPDKISESPASKTAMVEHLKSFPHAVPNSI